MPSQLNSPHHDRLGGAIREANAIRGAPRSAWLLPAATLTAAGAGLALLVWDRSTPLPAGFFGIRGFYGLFAAGFGGVGALLTWRRPGHPVGRVLAAAGLLAAVNFATFEYGLAASAGHRLSGARYVGWVELWIWVPFVALVTLYLFLLFPDGRLPTPRRRPLGWLGGASAVMAAAGVAFTPGSDRPNLPGLRNPLGLAPAALPLGVAGVGLAGLVCCVVLAAWSLVVRSRRGTDLERQQIKWLACSGCLVALALVPAVALSLTPGWPARVASGAVSAAVLAMPAAVAVAVLRYRLYDIDRVISRTLACAIITGVLAGVYAAPVLLATGVLGVRTPVAVAAATLAAAALFAPVRRRVQHAADRRFNRDRYDADQTLAAFAVRLKDAVNLDTIHQELVGVVQTTLEPASVWVWTGKYGPMRGGPRRCARRLHQSGRGCGAAHRSRAHVRDPGDRRGWAARDGGEVAVEHPGRRGDAPAPALREQDDEGAPVNAPSLRYIVADPQTRGRRLAGDHTSTGEPDGPATGRSAVFVPPPVPGRWMILIDATILSVMSAVRPPEYNDTNLALGAVDRADRTYLHEQVAAEIRRAIADGEAGPGERIPQAKDLAAVLGVNTNTVLRALRILRDEGLLEMGRGRAIVVAGTPERGAIVTKMNELLELGRRSGYRREELVELLQTLPG